MKIEEMYVNINSDYITNIANAIRTKNETTDTYKVYELADLIREVAGFNDDVTAIIEGSPPSIFINSVVTQLKPALFMDCKSLGYVDLQACTTIKNYAFQNCVNLTYVGIPVCSYIGSNAFYGCERLRTVNLSSVTQVTSMPYSGIFSTCSLMYEIIVPYSLYDAFLEDTNWAVYSSILVSTSAPIEEETESTEGE